MVAPAPARKKEVPNKDSSKSELPRKEAFRKEPQRKTPLKKEPAKKERCARCGVTITDAAPSVWHEHIVCEHCHSRLRAYEPAMAICPGAKPVLRYAAGAEIAPPPGVTGWMTSMGRKLVSIF